MNILFLSLLDFDTFEDRNIYSDFLREFIKNGHNVCCISPVERRKKQKTRLLKFGNNSILKLKIGNIQKVNVIEKGISTLRIESLFIEGIKKYYFDVKFDLILYSTPPVTFAKVVRFIKKRDRAKSYLMLKDIFPQNSVDLGMLSTSGLKGFVYKYFRKKEKVLYKLSDKIGCMSQANVDYIAKHNPDISLDKIEICPNCVEPIDYRLDEKEKKVIRQKYGLPLDKKIFVYGGNLGKPQDVPFICKCLKACADIENVYFLIVGNGTDKHYLEQYIKIDNPDYVKVLESMPKEDYDRMIGCCDVGLIFLNHKFTIPNFPSRLLSYMQAGVPVLACTDVNSDIGKVIVDGGFGWWCESNDTSSFKKLIKMISDKYEKCAKKEFEYLLNFFNVKKYYNQILGDILS